MSRRMLEEVRDSSFSSPEAKLAAENALYRLDNPERVVAPEGTPTAEPKPATKSTYLPINRVGLIFSGQEYFDDPAGFAAADKAILASGRCPEWNGSEYRRQQIEKNEFPIDVSKPCPVHERFKIVDGEVAYVRYAPDWTFEVLPYTEFIKSVERAKVPITHVPAVASAVAASGGKVVDGTCRKSV